jgi:NTE family protein
MKALDERGVKPDRYVATSMGAVVAACFASGLSYEEVLKRMLLLSRRDVARVSPTLLFGPYADSLFRLDVLRGGIRRLVPVRRFAELTVPLTVTAVDVDTGELVLFGDGGEADVPLVDALTASCALPLFYPPSTLRGRRLADGGLRAVLPLEVAASFGPDVMVAVRVGPSFAAVRSERSDGGPPLLQAHNRAIRTLMAAQTDRDIATWATGPIPLIVIEPRIEQAATFAVRKAITYVEDGYRAAVAALEHSPYSALLTGSAPGAPPGS